MFVWQKDGNGHDREIRHRRLARRQPQDDGRPLDANDCGDRNGKSH